MGQLKENAPPPHPQSTWIPVRVPSYVHSRRNPDQDGQRPVGGPVRLLSGHRREEWLCSLSKHLPSEWGVWSWQGGAGSSSRCSGPVREGTVLGGGLGARARWGRLSLEDR